MKRKRNEKDFYNQIEKFSTKQSKNSNNKDTIEAAKQPRERRRYCQSSEKPCGAREPKISPDSKKFFQAVSFRFSQKGGAARG